MHKALPLPWIESLFGRLVTIYGRAFLAQYGEVPDDTWPVIHADWAEKLAGFGLWRDGELIGSPAIDYALDILPERPPNVIQFRQLCRAYTPPHARRALPAPHPEGMPKTVREAFARLHEPNPEPQDLRWARLYVNTWGGHRNLSDRRAQHLKRALGILARHEERLKRDAARKPEAAPA